MPQKKRSPKTPETPAASPTPQQEPAASVPAPAKARKAAAPPKPKAVPTRVAKAAAAAPTAPAAPVTAPDAPVTPAVAAPVEAPKASAPVVEPAAPAIVEPAAPAKRLKTAAPRKPAKAPAAPRPKKTTAPVVEQAPVVEEAPVVEQPPAADTTKTVEPAKAVEPAKTPEAAPTIAPAASPGGLSILFVASEAHPFAKTGGLAEVAGALPDALAALGHKVTLVVPRYRGVDTSGTTAVDLRFWFGPTDVSLTVLEKQLSPGVTAALVDAPSIFDRDGLYGDANGDYHDNAWRFALFSRAALEYARARGTRYDVIHAHDWQTGLVPVYQKMLFSSDPIVGGVPVVFTIHNLAFQGVYGASILPSIGLGWDVMHVNALEYWGNVNFLKGGINFSEKLTTVSPTYAHEVVRPELGFGLDGALARRADDLVGIVNGIDVTRWNPGSDPFIGASYTRDDLAGKAAAKRRLLEVVKLPTDEPALSRPVVGMVSRLTDQKGFDLIEAAADQLMSLGATWVMLGSGEGRYEDLWRRLASRHPQRVSATIGFSERLAHQIEAGADIFLMPSRFEPCGLNQMYSLRYGTIPVVRATGGLADTVSDYDPATGQGTGFTFTDYTPGDMVTALRRALAAWQDRKAWAGIQRAGMERDHSWDASAREYVKVYRVLSGARADQPAAPNGDTRHGI